MPNTALKFQIPIFSNFKKKKVAVSAMHSSSSSVFTNYPHLRHGCFCPCPIHQGLRKENGIRSTQLVGSGGMPSSHSATVTALASAIGFQEGFGGPLFATSFVLACIVMYDATGVRLQAGRQGEVLNQIVYELPAEHPLAESRPLRELLGHTPLQVITGWLLGLFTAAIGHIITWITSYN